MCSPGGCSPGPRPGLRGRDRRLGIPARPYRIGCGRTEGSHSSCSHFPGRTQAVALARPGQKLRFMLADDIKVQDVKQSCNIFIAAFCCFHGNRSTSRECAGQDKVVDSGRSASAAIEVPGRSRSAREGRRAADDPSPRRGKGGHGGSDAAQPAVTEDGCAQFRSCPGPG
jgi:hypothetical protein